MKKGILPLVISIIVLIFASGCIGTGNDVSALAKSIPEVKDFLDKNPNADITISLWNENVVNNSIDLIRKDCGNHIEVKEYYRVSIVDGSNNLLVWYDNSISKPICIIKKSNTQQNNNTSGLGDPLRIDTYPVSTGNTDDYKTNNTKTCEDIGYTSVKLEGATCAVTTVSGKTCYSCVVSTIPVPVQKKLSESDIVTIDSNTKSIGNVTVRLEYHTLNNLSISTTPNTYFAHKITVTNNGSTEASLTYQGTKMLDGTSKGSYVSASLPNEYVYFSYTYVPANSKVEGWGSTPSAEYLSNYGVTKGQTSIKVYDIPVTFDIAFPVYQKPQNNTQNQPATKPSVKLNERIVIKQGNGNVAFTPMDAFYLNGSGELQDFKSFLITVFVENIDAPDNIYFNNMQFHGKSGTVYPTNIGYNVVGRASASLKAGESGSFTARVGWSTIRQSEEIIKVNMYGFDIILSELRTCSQGSDASCLNGYNP